ncbi:unnamed protein product [Musa acuminata subsp. burmannicoides]|uniref:(wild Malaysian banana) hypothetical protein n=1 Tax=Musa acuminata subsp. malaccensis TaxID=214687 RepID=A0A804ILK8_MUSAM|nr:PREDICTED: uncharacterized protein LOC103980732 isoform X1 [Musa acuminata subsp. malaccensis]CAG1841344.1 unnamed protein product [Musa acuminata subsp. malaccensis]
MKARPLTPIIRLQLLHSRRLRPVLGARPLSSATDHPDKAPPASSSSSVAPQSEVEARSEAYRRLENLDFMTAAKILFTTPPKRKKFGLDFHLVQLFFACLPSLAVYLVAQYARYEIRRMEAELEEKKKQDEEKQKAKEAEMSNDEEKSEAELSKVDEEKSEAELSKVKARLDALEEAVKEIADEKKKIPTSKLSKDQDQDKREKVTSVDEKSSTQSQLNTRSSDTERVGGSGP